MKSLVCPSMIHSSCQHGGRNTELVEKFGCLLIPLRNSLKLWIWQSTYHRWAEYDPNVFQWSSKMVKSRNWMWNLTVLDWAAHLPTDGRSKLTSQREIYSMSIEFLLWKKLLKTSICIDQSFMRNYVIRVVVWLRNITEDKNHNYREWILYHIII